LQAGVIEFVHIVAQRVFSQWWSGRAGLESGIQCPACGVQEDWQCIWQSLQQDARSALHHIEETRLLTAESKAAILQSASTNR
jgi:hypothetical protein